MRTPPPPWPASPAPSILHCFSAPGLLESRVERGYYVSFAGNVTYPKAADLREAAAARARRPHSRRDRQSVPRSAAAARQAERAGQRRSTRSPSSPRRAGTKRRCSSGRSTATRARPSASRRRERAAAQEVPRPALPRRRQHPRRHRPARRARPRRRRPRDRPGPRRADALLAEQCAHVHAVELDRRLEPHLREHRSGPERLAPLGRRAPARPRELRAGADEARREPPVQRRHARSSPRASTACRASSAVVRDGPARGRRPLLRRPVDEGLRRRLGADPARRRANRVPCRLAQRLPAAAERRLRARRIPAHPAAARVRRHPPRRRGRLRAIGARRSPTRSSSPVCATREQAVAALAELGLDPSVRAEALAPPCSSSWRGWLAMRRARGTRQDQPRARRRRRSAPTASTRS